MKLPTKLATLQCGTAHHIRLRDTVYINRCATSPCEIDTGNGKWAWEQGAMHSGGIAALAVSFLDCVAGKIQPILPVM